MDRRDSAALTARAFRRFGGALSTTAAVYALAACSVGPPEGAGSSATVNPAPASAVITIPGAAQDPLPPDAPIRVEASGGFLTDVSVSRDGDDANIAGSPVDSAEGRTTAWATTEPLGADEKYTVAAVAENPAGKIAEERVQVSTAPAGGATPGDGTAAGDAPDI